MRVKTSKFFLDIPVGSIGTIVDHQEEKGVDTIIKSVFIKFDCKKDPVLVGYPNSHFDVFME